MLRLQCDVTHILWVLTLRGSTKGALILGLQVYPWGGFEEDEPGEQYFQNLPTSSASATPAIPSTSAESNLGQPPPSLAPPSPPSPSPSPHLSNTDVLGEDALHTNTHVKQWHKRVSLMAVLCFVRPAAAYYPGKCMAHTSSTYTFTTCRILHPTDEQTRVTPRWAKYTSNLAYHDQFMINDNFLWSFRFDFSMFLLLYLKRLYLNLCFITKVLVK